MVQNRIRNSGVQTWYKMNLREVDVDEALLKKGGERIFQNPVSVSEMFLSRFKWSRQ